VVAGLLCPRWRLTVVIGTPAAALFLEEIRRRESAEREQRLIYLTKWVVGLTVAICVLTAAVVALTVVVVFEDDDPAPVTTAR
jgi:hypothetical protein